MNKLQVVISFTDERTNFMSHRKVLEEFIDTFLNYVNFAYLKNSSVNTLRGYS